MRRAIVSVLSLFLISLNLSSRADTVSVKTEYPKQEAHKRILELSGTIHAKYDAQLSPLESGVVESIYVEAGDKVNAGDALLSLDDTLTKLQLAQVKADLISAQVQQKEAQRQFDEVVSLAKQKVVADSLLAERQANLANANAALTNAQAQLALQTEVVKRHTLTAPFAGVIARRTVDVGEWISRQSQIFQLVSDKSLRLIVNLPQEHLAAIQQHPNHLVVITPDAMPAEQLQLPISNIVTISEPISRTVQVRVDLPDNTRLIPGMSARARFNLSNNNALLTWLPRTALKRHPDGGYSAFTVKADKVTRHNITLVKSESDLVAVTGIPEAAAVVVSGTEMLKDNQQVTNSNSKGQN